MSQSGALNFANSSLLTRIHCDKPSIDGYEVSNLISDIPRQQNTGFLAERFIKPPVCVTLTFPCSIDLEKVILDGKVGAQESSQFEIYTACGKIKTGVGNTATCFDDRIFVCVGRARCDDLSSHVVCFTTPQSASQSDSNSRLGNRSCAVEARLSCHRDSHVRSVTALTVRINCTLNGSAVALQWLEVWARPAAGTAPDVMKRLRELNAETQHRRSKNDSRFSFFGDPSNESPQCQKSPKNCQTDIVSLPVSESVVIPEEFQDALTQELMCLPVLLPSGMTVDQSTLDKYVDSRASWGCGPTDPFTGRAFDAGYKPVAHSSLKARLDQFVSCNMDKLNGIPRVLGGNTRTIPHSICHSGLLAVEAHRTEATYFGLNSTVIGQAELDGGLKEHSVASSRNSQRGNHLPIKPVLRFSRTSSASPYVRPRPAVRTNSTLQNPAKTVSLIADNQSTSTTQDGDSLNVYHRSNVACSRCAVKLTYLYRLRCSHLLCRQCLVTATAQASRRCPACDSPFDMHEPVRVNCINDATCNAVS